MGLAVGFIVADVTGVGDVEATGLGEGDVAKVSGMIETVLSSMLATNISPLPES